MQTKYLLSMALCLFTPILAGAENVSANNPLQAKVVSYKHDNNYDVEIVQTNLPALNKQLENLFCDHAFGNESDWKDCQKQDIRQSIEYDYKYRSENQINYYSQKYQYFHQDNKQYFQVCTMKYDQNHINYCKIYDITNPKKAVLLDKENMPMIAGMGLGSEYINRGNEKYFLSCLKNGDACDLYDLKNPKKPVLLEQDTTNYFLSEKQRNKIVSYYLAYGNYFNDDIGLACKKAIEKYGIQLANGHRAKIIPKELNQYCSAKVIEEIDDIDRNHNRHDIDFYKNNNPSQKYAYVINILTWETSRGRWGNVEVPDEKTMEKLIPRDVWSIFMAE